MGLGSRITGSRLHGHGSCGLLAVHYRRKPSESSPQTPEIGSQAAGQERSASGLSGPTGCGSGFGSGLRVFVWVAAHGSQLAGNHCWNTGHRRKTAMESRVSLGFCGSRLQRIGLRVWRVAGHKLLGSSGSAS
jgi:hypothetical protein